MTSAPSPTGVASVTAGRFTTSAAKAPHRRQGFTLLELMVSIAIMSMIMLTIYSTLNTMLDTRDELEHETKASRLGPMVLDQIEDDLRRAWVMDIEDDDVFVGEPRLLGGEHADSLAFLTTVDSVTTRQVGEIQAASDLCETGYQLRTNPLLPDVLELWRRQDFHVDDKPLEGGSYERMHDRVVSFQVRYRATLDTTSEKLERWDAGDSHSLPALVEIDLVLEVVPRTVDLPPDVPRTRHYHRRIPLLADSKIAMRVHHVLPSFELAAVGGSANGANQARPGHGDGEGEGADGDSEGGLDGGNGQGDNQGGGIFGGEGGGGAGGILDGGAGGGGGGSQGSGNPLDGIFGGGGGG